MVGESISHALSHREAQRFEDNGDFFPRLGAFGLKVTLGLFSEYRLAYQPPAWGATPIR